METHHYHILSRLAGLTPGGRGLTDLAGVQVGGVCHGVWVVAVVSFLDDRVQKFGKHLEDIRGRSLKISLKGRPPLGPPRVCECSPTS